MPRFKTLSKAEIQELTVRRPRMEELVEYLTYLSTLKRGDWGLIDLAPEENQRTIKRRTSTAARNQGKEIRWRRSPEPRRLVFEVMSAG